MKKKFLQFLFVMLVLPALTLIFSIPSNTKALEENCPADAVPEVTVTADHIDGSQPKAMPGEEIQVKIRNLCETSNIKVNIYVHPLSIKPESGGNIDPYKKISDYVIPKNETVTIPITIYGGESGTFVVRVISWEIRGTDTNLLGTVASDLLTITTDGIGINGPATAVKGESPVYKIKLYGHPSEKFSLYVDDRNSGLKFQDLPINDDPYYYDWTWDTSGTTVGSHKITVFLITKTGRELSESKSVTITSSTDPGSEESGGFNIQTTLNGFNIKALIGTCGTNELSSILCIVEKVILWLLDIGAVISFIMILYASIIYLTSYGDESKAELAKKTLIWSVIGVIVIGAAWSIMKIIEGLFNG